MSQNNSKITESKKLESVITQALQKIGARKESDICRYLPGPDGSYIHHFTMKKMKTQAPQALLELLEKNIFSKDRPEKLPHRPRAPRGSRKRIELLNLSRQDMDRLINLLRQSGEKEMVKKLSPRRDLKTVKKDLIAAIKQHRVDPDLWNAYCDCITSQQAYSAALQAVSAHQFA